MTLDVTKASGLLVTMPIDTDGPSNIKGIKLSGLLVSTDPTLDRVLIQEDVSKKPEYVTGTNPYLDVTGDKEYTLKNVARNYPVSLIFMDETGEYQEVLLDNLPANYVVTGYKINQFAVVNGHNLIKNQRVIKAMKAARSSVTLLPPRP